MTRTGRTGGVLGLGGVIQSQTTKRSFAATSQRRSETCGATNLNRSITVASQQYVFLGHDEMSASSNLGGGMNGGGMNGGNSNLGGMHSNNYEGNSHLSIDDNNSKMFGMINNKENNEGGSNIMLKSLKGSVLGGKGSNKMDNKTESSLFSKLRAGASGNGSK